MLRKETKLPLKEVKAWVEKQALWEVHKSPPKRIDHSHYYVTEVNKVHQADLLFFASRQSVSEYVQVYSKRN